MRPFALILCLTVLGGTFGARATAQQSSALLPAYPLTNQDIMRMARAGFGDSTIVKMIDSHGAAFDLSVDGLLKLKEAGVSQDLRAPGSQKLLLKGGKHISTRQVELLQERGKSRVVVQVSQQGVHFYPVQIKIMLGISSVQPVERFVGLVPESVNGGDLERTTCMGLHQPAQCGVRVLFPAKRVVRKRIQTRTIGRVVYAFDFRQSILQPPLH